MKDTVVNRHQSTLTQLCFQASAAGVVLQLWQSPGGDEGGEGPIREGSEGDGGEVLQDDPGAEDWAGGEDERAEAEAGTWTWTGVW